MGFCLDYLAPLRSELKTRILLSLIGRGKRLSELKGSIQTRETTILHVLKEFEKQNMTTKVDGVYHLTSVGLIGAHICNNYQGTLKVIDGFKDFWLNHDVTPIPPHLLLTLGDLQDSTLIQTDKTDLGKVYETFLQILLSSKTVKGISPIFHQDYVPVIEHLLSQGNTVELILTTDILNKTLTTTKIRNLSDNIEDGSLKLYLNENLRVALTVTEKNFSLGLFGHDGAYDDSMDLISLSQNAVKWGEELFRQTLNHSTRIEPDSGNLREKG